MWPRLALGTAGVILTRYGMPFLSRAWWLLKQLWHEVIGTMFVAMAFVGASTTIREWLRYGIGKRFATGAAFTLLMAYFGITSFLSARKLRETGHVRNS